MAFHESDHSIHVAHRFKVAGAGPQVEAELACAVASLASVSHPHILPVEGTVAGIAGSVWVITPYSGNHDGLVTLASLAQAKGGRLTPPEADRAMIQLLEATGDAHEAGCHHGPVSADEVLIDRRGSLAVELYGFRRRLTGLSARPAAEVARDELRSIVEIGYTLITGLSAEEPRIEASRLFPRLDRRWDQWFADGLDPLGGFNSADEAMGALPSHRRELEGRGSPVQTVIRRIQDALRPA